MARCVKIAAVTRVLNAATRIAFNLRIHSKEPHHD